jgi:hypothetical protein
MEQKRRENEPMEDPIPADELINPEFGIPEETPNPVQERELEAVLDMAVANVDTENDRIETVRVANEEIVNEPEVFLEIAVTNVGTKNKKT